MGLFDLFRKKSTKTGEDKELARLRKMVSNKLSQNLDREDALHRLVNMGTADSARVLLTRFNWSLDPSIKDNEEKELALSGIVAAGEPALEAIRQYCVRADRLTWPIKALRGIVEGARLEGELLSLLDEFDTDYMRNPEPKVQLLQALGEFSSDDVRVAVQPFLAEASEEVRFTAVTVVLSCANPEALESLVEAMADEESLRVKNRIASGIVDRGWAIPEELQTRLSGSLPAGFRVVDARLQGRSAT